MAQFVENVQRSLRESTQRAGLLSLKVTTGLVLSLTFSLIFQEIFQFGNLLFLFVIVLFTGAFLRIAKSWDWKTLLTFDLICVLVGLLLRLYVLVAPGA